MELDTLVALLSELVDADDDAFAGFDGALEPVGGFLDLTLDEAGFDRGDGAAELIDPFDQRPGVLLELGGERFEVVGAAERVGRVGRAGLVHQDLLSSQCDRRGMPTRERERLVVAVCVERLRAPIHGGERLDRDAHDVVLGLLCRQGGAPRLGVKT